MESQSLSQTLEEKAKEIEKIVSKINFTNPIRENNEKLREDLIDFSKIFQKNLEEADEYIESLLSKNKEEVTVPVKQDKKNIEEDMIVQNDKLKYRIKFLLNRIDHLEKKN